MNTWIHPNTATCCLASKSFKIPNQSMSFLRQPLVERIEASESTRFLLVAPPSVMNFGENNHARTKRLLLPDIHNLLPCSRFTLLRSVPLAVKLHQSLVRTLGLIGYQRQKELTSGFRPVLSNLIVLFFSSFLLNSAIAGRFSSRFNSVYFFFLRFLFSLSVSRSQPETIEKMHEGNWIKV